MHSTRRRAGGVYLYDAIRNDPRYATAKASANSSTTSSSAEAYGGWSQGLDAMAGSALDRGATYQPEAVRRGPGDEPSAARCRRTANSPIRGWGSTGPGRLRGAHEPGPDRAHRGRAARAARGRASWLRVGGARLRPRRAAVQRLRTARRGLRARRSLFVAARDRPRRERWPAQRRAVGRGPVLRAYLGRRRNSSRRSTAPSPRSSTRTGSCCSAATRDCAAIPCATRRARRGRC